MPSALRSRIALFALMGAFMIPIGMSSLRGLTHVLTCQEEARQPFSVVLPPEGVKGDPIVTTSTRLTREQVKGLCGGLSVNMGARIIDSDTIEMILPITNDTDVLWKGTIKLVINKTSVPVAIGEIEAGTTARESVEVDFKSGQTNLEGSLLIGP